MQLTDMAQWFEIPDPEPPKDRPIRTAPQHLAALAACGFVFRPAEVKLAGAGGVARNWEVQVIPARPSPHPSLRREGRPATAPELIEAFSSGQMARIPGHPYLAAILGARWFDSLSLGLQRPALGRVYSAWFTAPGVEGLLQPAERPTALAGDDSVEVLMPRLTCAAAMCVHGWAFQGFSPDRRVYLRQLPGAVPAELCGAAYAALYRQREIKAAALKAGGLSVVEEPQPSPLPANHPFHWAAAGAFNRLDLLNLESSGLIGSDSSPHRTHIRHAKVGNRSAVFTWDEWNRHEARIVAHLSKSAG